MARETLGFTIDASDLVRVGGNSGRAESNIPGNMKKELRVVGGKAKVAAIREAPFKTRRLRNTLELVEHFGLGDPSVSVVEDVPYGKFVRHGTRPHVILPRFKKALFWPGAAHPVRIVHHPGTKPNPYHERAADSVKGDVERAGFNIVTAAAKDITKL